jgi:F-type H+-transporting ATPase subunit b
MEQIIHAFGLDWRLLLINSINFGLLLFILYRYLYRPVFAMLEKRRQVIETGVHDAEAAKAALRNAEEAARATKTAALLEAETLRGKLQKEAELKRDTLLKEGEAGRQALLVRAQAEAEAARVRMLKDSEAEVAKLAVLAAEKILKTNH